MKMKIEFSYQHGSEHFPFCAKGDYGGQQIFACGTSFKDAEKQLLRKVQQALSRPEIPEPKEVEI
jgi:hypothetical protein